MKISNVLLASIGCLFIIVGGLFLLGQVRTTVPGFGDNTGTSDNFGSFNRTFNQLDELNSSVSSLKGSIENSAAEPGLLGMLNALMIGAWNTLKLIFSSFLFLNEMLFGMTAVFGIPSWIPGTLLLALFVVIVFSIYGAIFQRDL
jgi:hypothetical protein